jgi:thiol-disulfide isomerase/thioredoxin
MALTTLEPNPAWTAGGYTDTVETLEAYRDGLVFKVWGGDWCKDCRARLPDFGAALDAAGIPAERIEHYELDQDKRGPGVEEYGIEYIPTVVVERDGEEVVRFVEEESVPIAVWIATRLRETLGESDSDYCESLRDRPHDNVRSNR